VRIVHNFWGWSPSGIVKWIRYGWAKPISVWGIERAGSVPRSFERRVKVGPLCFGFGDYADAAKAPTGEPK
jgi:hypothetical protein